MRVEETARALVQRGPWRWALGMRPLEGKERLSAREANHYNRLGEGPVPDLADHATAVILIGFFADYEITLLSPADSNNDLWNCVASLKSGGPPTIGTGANLGQALGMCLLSMWADD